MKPLDPTKSIEVIRSKMDTQKIRTLIGYVQQYPWINNISGKVCPQCGKCISGNAFREMLPDHPIYSYFNIKDCGPIRHKGIIIIQMESLWKIFGKVKVPDLFVTTRSLFVW